MAALLVSPVLTSHFFADSFAESMSIWSWHTIITGCNLCALCFYAVQVRLLVPGAETVLGDAAADAELFVTDDYEMVSTAQRLQHKRVCLGSSTAYVNDIITSCSNDTSTMHAAVLLTAHGRHSHLLTVCSGSPAEAPWPACPAVCRARCTVHTSSHTPCPSPTQAIHTHYHHHHPPSLILAHKSHRHSPLVSRPSPQVELCDVSGLAGVKRLQRGADHESRLHHYKEDEALRKRNAAAVAAGEGLQPLGAVL